MDLFHHLGFKVNVEKLVTEPTRRLEHLGFVLDSVKMLASLTQDRHEKLRIRAQPLVKTTSLRKAMKFLGTVESCMLGVNVGNLYKYRLEDEKTLAFKQHRGKLSGTIRFSQLALAEVTRRVEEAGKHPRPLARPGISQFLQTDASGRGWGACLRPSLYGDPIATSGGAWHGNMKEEQINVQELEAI